MPAVDTEAVLRFIKTRGPVIPVQIAKEINSNLMMAGAVLSEMVSSGKLRVSKVKIGGSPLYYAIGQENRLTGFTQHLGSKERATYDALRQAGVIQDRATDALTRVTLRAIKDFAIPLTVTLNGQQEIFWKYFLISDSEAETKIKSLLGMEETKIPPTEQSENNHPQIRGSIEPRPMPQLKPQKPFVSGDEYDDEKPARTQQATIFEAASRSTPIPDTAASEKAVSAPVKDAEQPKEGKTPLQTEDPQIEKSPAPKRTRIRKPKQAVPSEPKAENPIDQSSTAIQQTTQSANPAEEFLQDEFFKKISAFFVANSITVVSVTCNKKGSDYDLIIKMNSPIGEMNMHCMALDKQSVSHSDVNDAFARCQLEHLPGLLLTSGEPTKKARALLDTKLYGLTFKAV
ncbi:MAG: hypothetical protein AABX47_07845 [Nanoarchaeota archaeon]